MIVDSPIPIDAPLSETAVVPSTEPVPTPVSTPSKAASDLASDVKGEPRDPGPTLPPPGTYVPRWWQNDAVKSAIGTTVAVGLIFLRAFILGVAVSREAVAVAVDFAVLHWMVALGISYNSSDNLKWK